MDKADYILLADFEDEQTSRVCGRTSNEVVAKAWSMGEGHSVYSVPVDGGIDRRGFRGVGVLMNPPFIVRAAIAGFLFFVIMCIIGGKL